MSKFAITRIAPVIIELHTSTMWVFNFVTELNFRTSTHENETKQKHQM